MGERLPRGGLRRFDPPPIVPLTGEGRKFAQGVRTSARPPPRCAPLAVGGLANFHTLYLIG